MKASANAAMDIDGSVDLGQMIRFHRKRAGLTQQDLATKIGVSPAYVGLIEQGLRGQRLGQALVRSMAQQLDLNLEQVEALFRASGYLEHGETLGNGHRDTDGVVKAIESDPALPDASKRLMISLYATLARPRSRR